MVAFAAETEITALRKRTPTDFERVLCLPVGNAAHMRAAAQKLFGQLAADIDEALGEDLRNNFV